METFFGDFNEKTDSFHNQYRQQDMIKGEKSSSKAIVKLCAKNYLLQVNTETIRI